MCRFIETIKVIDGKIYNLPLHNERLNNTRREVYNITDKICLEDYIKEIPAEGLWKCRVAYDCSIEEVTFDRYIIRPVKSLKPVYDDNIEYRLKSADREHLNS